MHAIIYTIGYAGWRPAHLKETVESRGALLVDVRYSPRSRAPQWTKKALQDLVGPDNYWHCKDLGNENFKSGGDIKLHNPDAAIAALKEVQRPLILLCGCKDHRICHRTQAAETLAMAFGGTVEHLYPFIPSEPATF